MKYILFLIPLIAVGVLLWTIVQSRRAPELGVEGGRLRPCPSSPNCVCSQDEGKAAIEPFAFEGEPEDAMRRIESVLASAPRAEVVEREPGYLRARFTTPILRYSDDVEFLLDEEGSVLHVRSASRVGHSDLGRNRSRVEELRAAWKASASAE